jgi:hypothetical protein
LNAEEWKSLVERLERLPSIEELQMIGYHPAYALDRNYRLKKFENNQRRPQILVSVRGIGYRLIGTRQA